MRTVGLIGCVALVACGKSSGVPRSSEAARYLSRIGDHAKAAFARDGRFPVGSVAATPSTSCCQQSTKWCVPAPGDWDDPLWRELDFRIDDRHLFQYSYQGTATEFTATAIGDPAVGGGDLCSGHVQTYVAHGVVKDGVPVVTLEKG